MSGKTSDEGMEMIGHETVRNDFKLSRVAISKICD
jgi:hypothetical protein